MYKQTLSIFLLATAGGMLFNLLHIPLPWTLGPLVITLIWKTGLKKTVYWPKKLRNIGMVVLGYMMGSPFTPTVGNQVLQQLPFMLIMTITMIALCLGTGYLAGRYTGVGLANSLIGSLPGGLSQMSVICEETKGTNASVVTLMQTVRVLTVVFVIPFLALHGIAGQVNPTVVQLVTPMGSDQLPVLALFLLVILTLIKLGNWANISNVYVLAPVLGTAALVLAGLNAPVLPSSVIALAQIFVGIRMGSDVDFSDLTNWKTIALVNLITVLTIIILLLFITYGFSLLYPMSFVTAFISMAPGGMSEMGLTALSANADLATVISFQLFRLLFILLIGVPVTKWLLQKNRANHV